MFRTRLRELRENAGFQSQQSFADAFGVAQSTVGGWESGKREPNQETTMRLARFLGVSTDELLGFDEMKDPPTRNGEGLSQAEQTMLTLFRLVPEKDQNLVIQMIQAALKSRESP